MNILIDNKDLLAIYGITCLDYFGALSFAAERENERTWRDKSGVDKNLFNPRLDAKEFVLKCVIKQDNEVLAYNAVNTLVEYLLDKGCFVLSLRDTARSIRECFICERSSTIVPEISLREQNSLFHFKIGFKDINPNALKFYNSVVGNSTTIAYTLGRYAVLYWGDGSQSEVSNSGNYTKADYAANGLIDIILDIDKNESVVSSISADFSADLVSGIIPQEIVFTDASTGSVSIWSWDFGDGFTSSEQNPTHTYETAGTYTVTLQIFNSQNSTAVETKGGYITVRNSWMKRNSTEYMLTNSTKKIGTNG